MKPEEIYKLAKLAQLEIGSDAAADVSDRITQVLSLVNQLQDANTEGVEPMSHPLDATQTLRADEVTASNEREKLQAMAPQVEDGLYLVPKVID